VTVTFFQAQLALKVVTYILLGQSPFKFNQNYKRAKPDTVNPKIQRTLESPK